MSKDLIEARLTAGTALDEVAAGKLPSEIQWMPPGARQIHALVNGEPGLAEVNVTSADAARVAAQLQDLRSRAAEGREDIPFFDFNHDDAEASANPTEFYWAGDDAKKGGIRARLEWTKAGEEAVTGKTYRRFSPTFALNKSGGIEISGVNLGGLVNRAAFKEIAPIMSRRGGAVTTEKENQMNEEQTKQFVALVAAVAALTATVQEIKAKQTEKNPDLLKLETRLATMEELTKIQAKKTAEEIVEKAAATGKIPPQNKEIRAKWVDAIEKDPKAAELLSALPDNAALARVTAGAGAGGTSTETAASEHEFVVKAKAVAKEKSLSEEKAFLEVAAKNPELYEQFRASLPKK